MSTRRSTRVRARDGGGAAEDGVVSAVASLPTHEVKRARRSSSAQATPKGEDLAWLRHAMTMEKRERWDTFMKKHLFVEKPCDVYDLFDLAVHFAPQNPQEAFLSTAGIRLTGPFDLLARGNSSAVTTHALSLHGRFFFDPPEVVTVAEDADSPCGAHWGLHRDKPHAVPAYVVYAVDANVCSFEPVALSLFTVLRDRLDARLTIGETESVEKQLRLVMAYIDQDAKMQTTTQVVQNQRKSELTAASLDGLGIVVPYDAKKRTGFRELPIAGEALRDLLASAQSGDASAKKKIANLTTRATIANDECDFGTSLLLGHDLFTGGLALQKEALQMLRIAYLLLNWKEFAFVVANHCKARTPGTLPLRCLTEACTDGATTTVDLP